MSTGTKSAKVATEPCYHPLNAPIPTMEKQHTASTRKRSGKQSVISYEKMACLSTGNIFIFLNLGGANSVLRSCSDEPLYRNGQQDLEDGNLTVWYHSCTMDLCNNAPSFFNGIIQ